MFLDKLRYDNPALIDAAIHLHRRGMILPDSYVVDVDMFRKNASCILDKAREHDIRLFFMLKQLGRNPLLAQHLVDLGYEGAVAVDFREALLYMKQGIPLCNVGHLVQIPCSLVKQVVAYRPKYITVFSYENACEISDEAQRQGIVQDILLRVMELHDVCYDGQHGSIPLKELKETATRITTKLKGVRIAGFTSFPCFLYSKMDRDIEVQSNLETILKAAQILENAGLADSGSLLLNAPSATCCRTLDIMAEWGVNCGEPGHGLTGTTPLHAPYAGDDQPEKCCVLYLSEISHSTDKYLHYCYGGGYYRRSHVRYALVSDGMNKMSAEVFEPDNESIDYHFLLKRNRLMPDYREDLTPKKGDTVIMAFRYQIFVTRSNVVLLDGVSSGNPVIAGIYDSQGNRIDRW